MHYFRLNEWISKNNYFTAKKKVYAYLILPNATIKAHQLRGSFFVANGGNSFFKIHKSSVNPRIMLRGYKNKSVLPIEQNKWLMVNSAGRELTSKNDQKRFLGIVELLTSRIPSLLMARELMFRKFSLPLFDKNISKQEFAVRYGYRLWDAKGSGPKNEMLKREKFLDEYVRRTETTLLQEANVLYKENRLSRKKDFSKEYFNDALKAYLSSLAGEKRSSKKQSLKYYVGDDFSKLSDEIGNEK